MIRTYTEGLELAPEYRYTPMRDLLFRTFQMLYYISPRPICAGMVFYVMDDYGNCVESNIQHARVYYRT